MRALYFTNVTIHVLAAMFWLGGMLFLGVIGAPVLRAVEPASLRQKLFQDLGMRFRTAGWIAIGVLVLTGVGNMYFRGWLAWDGVLASSDFWRSGAGSTLLAKLVAVTVMVAVSAVHDFALGPAASRAVAGTPEAMRLRKRAASLARANALIGIAIVVVAVRLARGG